jgi:hypothetical protein
MRERPEPLLRPLLVAEGRKRSPERLAGLSTTAGYR